MEKYPEELKWCTWGRNPKVLEHTPKFAFGNGFIEAWKVQYFDKETSKNQNQYICFIYHSNGDFRLNLGECHDGSPFQSMNHSINQAKQIC